MQEGMVMAHQSKWKDHYPFIEKAEAKRLGKLNAEITVLVRQLQDKRAVRASLIKRIGSRKGKKPRLVPYAGKDN
jgi:hypothetical protein